MVAPALIAGGIQVLGGLLGGRSARRAAQQQAESLRQAGNQAFESSRFRPVGITSRFGSSNFQVDPTTGALLGAGYELSPELASIQDRLFSQLGQGDLSGQALQQAQGLFGLGGQFLPTSAESQASPEAMAYAQQLRGLASQVTPTSYDPTAAAQQYVQQQQALLRPERERQLAETREGLFRSGRGGLAVAQGGDLQNTNPEMAAYFNAMARQDAELAARGSDIGRQRLAEDIRLGVGLGANALQTQQQAEDIARQRLLSNLNVGTGLFSSGLDLASRGLAPLQSQLGIAESIEKLGQQPLMLGAALGARASQINANASQMRLSPQTAATNAQASADRFNPFATALTAAGSAMGGMNFGSLFGGGAPQADMGVVGYNGPGRGNWF
jgi:hypothetical protein